MRQTKTGVLSPLSWALFSFSLVFQQNLTLASPNAESRIVTIGSTANEISSALQLCKRYRDDCKPQWYESERQRSVKLGPYRLDSREVTVAEFAAYTQRESVVTEAELRRQTALTDASDPLSGVYAQDIFWYNAYPPGSDQFPVVHVTLNDAAGYCRSLGKRLPTEAEWEYAARGDELHQYPWGDNWRESAQYRGPALQQMNPFPSASFAATGRGYYDLSGGVSEWTTTTDEDAVVVKGGSRFSRNLANLRAAARRLEYPDYSGDDIGFRCAQTTDFWPGARDADPLFVDQLLRRAILMRAERERDLAQVNDYLDNEIADAVDQLFERE